jgi:hypothetical protein
MAAAELDCQKGKKARQDLLSLKRKNQILVISGDDSEGYPPPFFDEIWEKMKHLPKLSLNVKKVYLVNGTWGLSSFTGEIDSLKNPFTLSSSGDQDALVECSFRESQPEGLFVRARLRGFFFFW